MDDSAFLALLLATTAIGYHYITSLRAMIKSHQDSLNLARMELKELRDNIAELTKNFERRTLAPIDLEAKHFDQLPALDLDKFMSLSAGDKLNLLLKTHTGQGSKLFYTIEYVHHELSYRSPGRKDAVALGKARLDTSDEFRAVRILFSRPHATATLRGLILEGHVKEI